MSIRVIERTDSKIYVSNETGKACAIARPVPGGCIVDAARVSVQIVVKQAAFDMAQYVVLTKTPDRQTFLKRVHVGNDAEEDPEFPLAEYIAKNAEKGLALACGIPWEIRVSEVREALTNAIDLRNPIEFLDE